MSEARPLKLARLRLLVLLAPGLLFLVWSLRDVLVEPANPGIGPGSGLWVAASVSMILLCAGALVHRRAVANVRAGQRGYWKSVAYMLPVLVGTPLALFGMDRAAGMFLAFSSRTPLPVFPPHARVSFHTAEFAFTAEANSIGIRDREIDVKRKPAFRAVALGDSMTFGWGVEIEQTWVKLAERRLVDEGWDAEVLNLGCPGSSVDVFAFIAERAIPLLKPDLVLVMVLQGDDLKQLDLGGTAGRLYGARGSNLQQLFGLMFRPAPVPAEAIRAQWRDGAEWIQRSLTPDEKARFDALDEEVKALFLGGDLNPPLIRDALLDPDYLAFTLKIDRPEVQKAIEVMGHHLKRIQQAAEKEDAAVVVLSVPWCYTSGRQLGQMRRMGYRLGDEALRSDAPDEAIRSACRLAGVEFYSCTSRFRQEGARRQLFFDFDSHYNTEGHSVYAEEVAKMLLGRKNR